MDMGSLTLLVFVVIISCCIGTLLSWWWMRSISPPTYQYCASCAHQLGVLPPDQAVLTDGVVARPVQGQAGTFQRLGMKTARPGMGLEVGHLETRPLPTPAEEVEEKNEDEKAVKDNEVMRKGVKQYMISPGSAEVLARKNTVQSFPAEYRMSRRTLVFPSQSHNSSVLGLSTEGEVVEEKESSSVSSPHTIVGVEAEEGEEETKIGDTKQRQVVRRSVSARKEKSKLSLLRRQEDAGLTSQSEDERGGLARKIRRHSRAASKAGSDKATVVNGFDNPGYVATSDTQEGVSGPGYQNLPNIHFSPRRS